MCIRKREMSKLVDDFMVTFDENEKTVKIWRLYRGQRLEPPVQVPFAKLRVEGLMSASEQVGIRLVARSAAMQKLFGLDEHPDPAHDMLIAEIDKQKAIPNMKKKKK